MTSAKLSGFLTPSPLVTVTNQLILFLLSANWDPPPIADVIYGSPISALSLLRTFMKSELKHNISIECVLFFSLQTSSVTTPHLLAVTGTLVALLHLGNILHEALAKLPLQLVVVVAQVNHVRVSRNSGIDDSTHSGFFEMLECPLILINLLKVDLVRSVD